MSININIYPNKLETMGDFKNIIIVLLQYSDNESFNNVLNEIEYLDFRFVSDLMEILFKEFRGERLIEKLDIIYNKICVSWKPQFNSELLKLSHRNGFDVDYNWNCYISIFERYYNQSKYLSNGTIYFNSFDELFYNYLDERRKPFFYYFFLQNKIICPTCPVTTTYIDLFKFIHNNLPNVNTIKSFFKETNIKFKVSENIKLSMMSTNVIYDFNIGQEFSEFIIKDTKINLYNFINIPYANIGLNNDIITYLYENDLIFYNNFKFSEHMLKMNPENLINIFVKIEDNLEENVEFIMNKIDEIELIKFDSIHRCKLMEHILKIVPEKELLLNERTIKKIQSMGMIDFMNTEIFKTFEDYITITKII